MASSKGTAAATTAIIDDHHQIDSHVGFGLDRNAPN
jgi:hypothetical protein